MELKFEEKNGTAVITGAEGVGRRLILPETISGLTVTGIAAHAFEGADSIELLSIPKTVVETGSFAFYRCANLKELQLTEHAEEWGNGVFRSCESLSGIRYVSESGRCGALRRVIEDLDRPIMLTAVFPGETIQLFFPGFTQGFEEDTMARAIHPFIEGLGVAYRETILRNGIDFRAYDRIFPRMLEMGAASASKVALPRLMYPRELLPASAESYKKCLTEASGEMLPVLIRGGEREEALFWAESGLLTENAAQPAIYAAAETADPELAAVLMSVSDSFSAGPEGIFSQTSEPQESFFL